PEIEPAARQLVDGGGTLREDGRLVEGQGGDDGAEADPPRRRRQPRQRRPRLERGPCRVAEEPGEVVGAIEPREPAVLGRPRETLPPLPGEALLALDHHVQLELLRGHPSSRSGSDPGDRRPRAGW